MVGGVCPLLHPPLPASFLKKKNPLYFDGIVVPVDVFIMVLFFKLEVVLLLLYSDDFCNLL